MFFEDVVAQARGRRLLSAEHFTVDATLLEAWAGQKSFKRKDQPNKSPDDPGNPTINLVVDACVVAGTGTGERDAAIGLVAGLPPRRVTVGGNKGYGTRGFVETLRNLGATPHVALKAMSRTLDRRTTGHAGYDISQRVRKRIEEIFGWMKTIGGLRKLRHRGGARVNWQFLLASAAYNLVRMRTLETAS